MADVITRLLMDSSNYTSGIEKAQKSLDKYMDKNMNLGNVVGNVTKVIGKFAVGIGVAATAGEAFNKIMGSSQKLGDKMTETIEAAKASVDQFFYSLGAGEFSTFLRGLDEIIAKSKKAQQALDQLGNTQISHGYFSAKNEADIAKAQTLAKNKFAPLDERERAFKEWQSGIKSQQEINKTLQHDLVNAIVTSVEKEIGADKIKVSMQDVEMALRIDVTNPYKREELKNQFAADYEAYRKAAEKSSHLYQNFDKNGNVMLEGGRGYERRIATDEEREKAQKEITRKYREAIVVNAMLNKYSDEQLQGIAEMGEKYINLNKAIDGLVREFNETANEYNNANKNIKGFNPVSSLEGYKVYSGSTVTGGGGSGKKEKLPSGPSFVEIDQMIKLSIDRMADNPLDQEILDAIAKKKQLPVLMQPVQMLMQMNEEEESNIDGDEVVEALKRRMEMYDIAQAKIQEYTNMLDYATDEEKIKILENIELWKSIAGEIKKTKQEGQNLTDISSALGTMGSALQGTGNEWLAFIGQTASASAALLQVVQSLTVAKGAEAIAEQAGKSWPMNLIAIASTIAAMTSAIASVKGMSSFAEGGIVGGTNYQDGITARVSSGEMFINEADQKRLYDAIHTGNFGGGGGGRTIITGEQIVTVVNNFGKRTGKGTILKG